MHLWKIRFKERGFLKSPGTVLLCVDRPLLDLEPSQVLAVALVGLVVVLQLADPGAVEQQLAPGTLLGFAHVARPPVDHAVRARPAPSPALGVAKAIRVGFVDLYFRFQLVHPSFNVRGGLCRHRLCFGLLALILLFFIFSLLCLGDFP